MIGEQLRADVQGVWASAQIEVRLRWIDRVIEEQNWQGAAQAIVGLARHMTTLELSAKAWQEIVTLGVTACLRANERGMLAELCEGYLWMGWSGKQDDAMPWGMAQVCASLGAKVDARMAAQLGDLLAKMYPAFALGPYLSAHYREQYALLDGVNASALSANIWRFQRAATLATQSGHEDFARHCLLRQGVCGLLSESAPSESRKLLKTLDVEALSPQERLWYALGMAHSEFWLDRVRGADVLDDLTTQVTTHQPGEAARVLSMEVLRQGLEWMIGRERGAMQAAELDRIRGVIALIYQGDERGESLEELLELREVLASERGAALDESGELLWRLWQRSDVMGDGWRESTRAARVLRACVLEEQGRENLRLPEPEAPWLEVSHLSGVLLESCQEDDHEQVEDMLRAIRDVVAKTSHHTQALRPFFAALPGLLDWWSRLVPSEKKRRRLLDRLQGQEREALLEDVAIYERLGEMISRIVQAMMARHVPQPSYGWWLLGAHLVEHQLFEAAQPVVRSALASRHVVDEKLQAHVMGHMLYWASAKQSDPVVMRRWLELCESP